MLNLVVLEDQDLTDHQEVLVLLEVLALLEAQEVLDLLDKTVVLIFILKL